MANQRRRSLQPGTTLARLFDGGETLDKIVGRLFKQSGYNVDKTERGIVFLDNMHHLNNLDLGEFLDEEKGSQMLIKEITGENARVKFRNGKILQGQTLQF